MINEAAKPMLRKIVKLDTSRGFEVVGNSNNFLLENYMPATQDFVSSSTRIFWVTLAKASANLGLSFIATIFSYYLIILSDSKMHCPDVLGQ
jgi:heat shock transcription factor, other eukaryote